MAKGAKRVDISAEVDFYAVKFPLIKFDQLPTNGKIYGNKVWFKLNDQFEWFNLSLKSYAMIYYLAIQMS